MSYPSKGHGKTVKVNNKAQKSMFLSQEGNGIMLIFPPLGFFPNFSLLIQQTEFPLEPLFFPSS